MTAQEAIAKIRAEIERLIEKNPEVEYDHGRNDVLEYLLSFIDTLEEELRNNSATTSQFVCEELEEEIEMEWDSFSKHLAEYDDDDSDEVIWLNKFSFTDIARHFANWQYQKDREKFAEIKTKTWFDGYDEGIEKGKKNMKEQMMKRAVEGEICGRVYDHINVRFADGVCKYLEPKNISHIPADVSKYNIGDKVHIIIVKED